MTTLAVHHTAGNQNRPAIDDWNTGKKWYNWIIDGKGKLHEFKTTSNRRNCGLTFDLAFSGDFTRVDPTKAQVETWEAFKRTHTFDTITTHGELAKKGCATASACPGRLLQFITLNPAIIPPMSDEQREQIIRLQGEVRDLTAKVHEANNKVSVLEDALRQERSDHGESIAEKELNFKKYQDELNRANSLQEALVTCESGSLTDEQKKDLSILKQIRNLV